MNYEKKTDRDWKFIAYYTDKYTTLANRLRRTLDKFDVSYAIEEVPDQGGWLKNVLFKPTFIKKYLGERVVYIDADALLERDPVLFDNIDCDFAYWLCHQHNQKFLASGTLYFSPMAITLVEKWERMCQSEEHLNDQELLDQALRDSVDISIKILPIEYCQIFDFHEQSDEPVIVHTQASRRFRATI